MDVTEATFQTAVIDRSHTVPVVVDFWAEWCGPCRQLGPAIEKAVAARHGTVELAKIDVDSNQNLARTFRIQSIPAVMAFKDGEVAAEFVGAQPPAAIERFLDGLVPSEVDELIAKGDETSLRRAVELEPSRADAAVPLARILYARGDTGDALELLERVPGSFAADGLRSRIELHGAGTTLGLANAFEALDANNRERALELLLDALPSADSSREDVRKVIVGILDELSVDDPLARESRRKLAAALY
jgi:putative thioredoxin